jgi:threonine/homoserine/homoserine lactone efflux protein
MPSSHSIILFMISALALNLSPGPSILYILSRSIGQGREAGLVSVLGLATATLVHALAMALGLSTLFLYSPLAFAVVKYLGAAYLVYLGIGALLSRGPLQPAAAAAPLSLGSVYRQGVVTDLHNPKVAHYSLAFLPQFVEPAAGSTTMQILFFGLLFHVTGVPVNLMVALAGGRLATFLARRPAWARVQGWITGTILIGLGLRLALSEQR